MEQKIFTVHTRGSGFYEFTSGVAKWVHATAPKGYGLLTLFICHTSASLIIQENADQDVQTDLLEFFNRLVPPSSDQSMSYITHTYEGFDDMPAHIKAALLPTHLSIPVIDRQMLLGKWQGIYLFEHRTAHCKRQVVGHLSK